jgi:hypothetical protein
VWNPKDPADTTDFALDWTDLLAGDTIATLDAVAITPTTSPPLEEVPGSPSLRDVTDTTTTIWLQGGVGGQIYLVEFTITTGGGRIYQRAATLSVQETIPATTWPVLVTLAQAKDQLRITHTDDDQAIRDYLAHAHDIVLTFMGDRVDETWTVANAPGAVRASILKQVAYLWRFRGSSDEKADESGLAPGVRWLLQSNGYRDLTLG